MILFLCRGRRCHSDVCFAALSKFRPPLHWRSQWSEPVSGVSGAADATIEFMQVRRWPHFIYSQSLTVLPRTPARL